MHFSFSASGTPSDVRESISQQAKAQARANAALWPAASAVRDYIANAVTGLPVDRQVSVSVSVSVVLEGAEREPAAGSVTSTATGTVPVDVKAVAAVGEDRLIATDPAVSGAVTGDGSGEAIAAYPAPDETVAPGSTAPAVGRRTGDRR